MIFAATHRQVTAGKKTATRRPMVPYPLELPARRPPGIGHQPAPPAWPKKVRAFDQDWKALSYKPGDVRAVQPGRGQHAVGHIEIQAVRYERLGQITEPDARAEGFASVAEFKAAWVGLHDKAWWAGTLQILDELRTPASDLAELAGILRLTERTLRRRLRELHACRAIEQTDDGWIRDPAARRLAVDHRFRQHADRAVWVITFQVVDDPALMLVARPPRAGDRPEFAVDDETPENRGYTKSIHQALHDEPEVIDDAFGNVVTRMARVEPTEARERRNAIQRARDAIAELERTGSTADRGRAQRLKKQLSQLDPPGRRNAA